MISGNRVNLVDTLRDSGKGKSCRAFSSSLFTSSVSCGYRCNGGCSAGRRFRPRVIGAEFRVALIGAGGRGTGAAADCLHVAPNIKLVAIADAFSERAEFSAKILKQHFPQQFAVPQDQTFVGLDA